MGPINHNRSMRKTNSRVPVQLTSSPNNPKTKGAVHRDDTIGVMTPNRKPAAMAPLGPGKDAKKGKSKSSPRSISQYCTIHEFAGCECSSTYSDSDDEEGDASSTVAITSPPRSNRSLPFETIINYTNQACEAFDSSQYDLAMRLFQDAHGLLHKMNQIQDNEDLRIGADIDGDTDSAKKLPIRLRPAPGRLQPNSVDEEFISSTSYIYQRLEFDEGMNTFSQPLKMNGGGRDESEQRTMDSTIWYNKGRIYVHYHSWEKAMQCFQSALDAQKEDGENGYTHVYIAALQSMGQIQYRLGQYKAALPFYKQAIRCARITYGEEHETIGAALNSLSVLYYHLTSSIAGSDKSKEYLKYAKDYSRRSLSIRKRALGPKHKDVGTTYNNIGRLHVMQCEFEPALECYQKALKIRAETLGKESLDYAATSFNAGQSYHHIRDLTQALKYYQEFLSVAVKHFTRNHRDVAVVLGGIAEIHQDRGEMEDALRLYKESLEAGRKALGENHPEVAMILNRLGNFYYLIENYEGAYEAYSKGLKIERKSADKSNVIVSLCNLGEIHRQREEWDAAIKIFQEVLKIQRKVFGKDAQTAEIATTHHVIGLTYSRKGDTDSALKYLQEALLMRRNVFGDDHIDVTPTLTTIGILFSRGGKLTLALELLKESFHIRRKHHGKDNRDVALTLYNIALIHQKQGSLTKAINCLTEVLRIERKVLGEDHKDVAITLFKLGETFKKHNDLDRALIFFKKALKVERKVMIESDPLTVARTLTEMGNIYLSRGQTGPMMEAFNEAARIYQSSSMSPNHVAVSRHLYAIDLACPRGAPAA